MRTKGLVRAVNWVMDSLGEEEKRPSRTLSKQGKHQVREKYVAAEDGATGGGKRKKTSSSEREMSGEKEGKRSADARINIEKK